MVMQPCDGAQTAEACATSLDETMEGKTRSSKRRPLIETS